VQPKNGTAGGYWVVFLFERRIIVDRSARAEQAQLSPYNNHLLDESTVKIWREIPGHHSGETCRGLQGIPCDDHGH